MNRGNFSGNFWLPQASYPCGNFSGNFCPEKGTLLALKTIRQTDRQTESRQLYLPRVPAECGAGSMARELLSIFPAYAHPCTLSGQHVPTYTTRQTIREAAIEGLEVISSCSWCKPSHWKSISIQRFSCLLFWSQPARVGNAIYQSSSSSELQSVWEFVFVLLKNSEFRIESQWVEIRLLLRRVSWVNEMCFWNASHGPGNLKRCDESRILCARM